MGQKTQIPVEDLRIGHYVVLPFGWKNHPFLFSSFRIKDEEQLKILRTLGTKTIPVDLDKSIGIDTPEEDIPPEEEIEVEIEPTEEQLAAQQQQATRRSIRMAEREFTNAMNPLRESLTRLNLKPEEGLATVANMVRQAAGQLIAHPEPVGFHLVRSIRNGDPLLINSLNVAYIAMLIAKEAEWEPLAIQDVGLAGLVHNIGELRIPTQISRKKGELSKAEQNFMKMHVQYGYDQLTQLKAFSQEVRTATLQHHECLDGSGYPNGLKGDAISPMARLLGVVDFYEESIHPKNGERILHPNQVIAALFKKADKQYDAQYIKLLIKVLGVYPPGSIVKLSDDTIALVVSSNPTASLKPVVLPFVKGSIQEGVDMIYLEKDERTIKGIVASEDLTPQHLDFFGVTKHTCYYYSFSPI